MGLTTRILALMLVLAICAAVIVLVPSRSIDQQLARERATSELFDAAGRAADGWLAVKSELTGTLVTLSRSETIQRVLGQPDYAPARDQALDLLGALSAAHDANTQIELLGPDGARRLAAGPLDGLSPRAFAEGDAQLVQWRASLGPKLTWIHASDTEGRPRLIAGAALAALPGQADTGSSGVIGYLLVHMRPRVLENIRMAALERGLWLDYQLDGALGGRPRSGLLTQTEPVPAPLLAALAQTGGQGAVAIDDWLAVKRRADSRVEVVAWRTQPAQLGFGTLAGRDAALLALLAIVIGIALLLRTLYAYVLRPVIEINSAALAVAGGDLEVRVKENRADEIGQLGGAFNQMVESLRENIHAVRDLSYTDTLTGLPNRRMFDATLSEQLAIARRQGNRLALLFLDLDEFKRVNDSLGHQAGDQLLLEVSQRLTQCLAASTDILGQSAPSSEEPDQRSSDFSGPVVARLGGDEFLILLPKIDLAETAASVSQRILDALEAPVMLSEQSVYIGVSIGISVFPDDARDSEALLQRADKAMYLAKAAGRKTYKFYADSMNVSAADQLRVQSRLRTAINDRILEVRYHPMFRAEDGAACQAEALLRWEDPELGFVSPATFIPVAEAAGDITLITEYVLNEVCGMLSRWSARLPPGYRVAVNVSAIDVQRTDLPALVRGIVSRHGVHPSQLIIELTESGLLTSDSVPEEVIGKLKDVGVAVALDDFGTGYSSLGYLRRFPIDELKLDQSFVKRLGEEGQSSDEALVRAVQAIASSLRLETVAEGIETVEQLVMLRQMGYDVLQGYLFTMALSEAQFAEELSADPLVHRWRSHWIELGFDAAAPVRQDEEAGDA